MPAKLLLAVIVFAAGLAGHAQAAEAAGTKKVRHVVKHVPATKKVAAGAHVAGHPKANAAHQLQATRRLAVASSAALVVEQGAKAPIYEKNSDAVVPIASISKLMTAMVVLDAVPAMGETIRITADDVDTLRGSHSRLQVGAELAREDALLLALMSSENRAAHALARHYPGGLPAFIAAMNRKAADLGMFQTRFEDPTGLSSNNVSTAHDLAKMVAAAYRYPLIREFSTTGEAKIVISGRELAYNNTNRLVKNPSWDIGLSKTGYIQEAGKCLVMQAWVAEKPVVIVLLDSAGKLTRSGDANRIKRWMESTQAKAIGRDRSV